MMVVFQTHAVDLSTAVQDACGDVDDLAQVLSGLAFGLFDWASADDLHEVAQALDIDMISCLQGFLDQLARIKAVSA